jgi:2-oxo-4-hydroxy-4-carboxy-5-ureidoimidazoline decarboxylase
MSVSRSELRRLCGSRRWASLVEEALRKHPATGAADLRGAAAAAFDQLERDDWLEAFAHHPRIGDLDSLRSRFSPHAATADLSASEQAAAAGASERVLRALAAGNARYEHRFGHVFLVCATGKTADEMLAILEARLGNDPDQELRIAAAEQRKITALRIDRWLGDGAIAAQAAAPPNTRG